MKERVFIISAIIFVRKSPFTGGQNTKNEEMNVKTH